MDTATLSGYLDRIEEQGYCIVENAIDPDLIKELTNSVAHLEEAVSYTHLTLPTNREV